MGIVTLATWKRYAKKSSGDATDEALYQGYLDTAEAIVLDYLGFSPASATYTNEVYVGNGLDSLQLSAKPISALSALSVDGVAKTTTDYRIEDERITHKAGEIFTKGAEVKVTYTAGYATVPAVITSTIMRIAAILSAEAGENIAVTSTSFDDGTRSFVNYTNFAKYLAPLASLRIVRMP